MIKKLGTDQNYRYYNFLHRGQIIGKFQIQPPENGLVSIWSVELDEKFRGKGLGKKLVKEALDVCRKMKATRVGLTCMTENKRARHIYELFGFTITKPDSYNQWMELVL